MPLFVVQPYTLGYNSVLILQIPVNLLLTALDMLADEQANIAPASTGSIHVPKHRHTHSTRPYTPPSCLKLHVNLPMHLPMHVGAPVPHSSVLPATFCPRNMHAKEHT